LGVKAAFKKLRYFAWHRLRSPGATAIKKLDLKRKAIGKNCHLFTCYLR